MTIFSKIVFTLIFGYFLFCQPLSARQRCKPLLDKVHKIQQEQRSSYSLKRGNNLRRKEDKARAKWWKCETTSTREVRLAITKKEDKAFRKTRKTKQTKSATRSRKAPTKQKTTRLRKPIKKKAKYATLKYSSNAKIKNKPAYNLSDFKGEKLTAWKSFYQEPSGCIKPKKLSKFVACSEQRKIQKVLFERKLAQTILTSK